MHFPLIYDWLLLPSEEYQFYYTSLQPNNAAPLQSAMFSRSERSIFTNRTNAPTKVEDVLLPRLTSHTDWVFIAMALDDSWLTWVPCVGQTLRELAHFNMSRFLSPTKLSQSFSEPTGVESRHWYIDYVTEKNVHWMINWENDNDGCTEKLSFRGALKLGASDSNIISAMYGAF